MAFGGISFSVVHRRSDSEFATIPVSSLRKILTGGRVKVRILFRQTDDTCEDRQANIPFSAEELLEKVNDPGHGGKSPSGVYRRSMKEITVSFDRNECYAITEL
jgi:hypothetical protein